jgi:hypothetical protein
MQPGGDLQDAWMMFDHVKHVKKWTTMACHVYDSTYCRVMTIVVCDMQSKDAAVLSVLWKNLNVVLARHGIPEPKFKGFMANSAQTNWNAFQVIYGSGDAAIPIKDQERTCLFHWTQSLKKHTKADIWADLQDQHRLLCNQYKNAASLAESETQYLPIRAWWLSSRATIIQGLFWLEFWLVFWHFHYRQWGGFMQLVRYSVPSVELPSSTISTSNHPVIHFPPFLFNNPYPHLSFYSPFFLVAPCRTLLSQS